MRPSLARSNTGDSPSRPPDCVTDAMECGQMTDTSSHPVPRGNLVGFCKYLGRDLLSGFLVFLIALPLCLGISLASGYPAIAGIFAAIVGGVVCSFLSNSELTIKGPAAGLIAIAIMAITDFSEFVKADGITPQEVAAYQADHPEVNSDAEAKEKIIAFKAYRLALSVGVAAGIFQILFGLLRSGILGEFFPTATVHGMLAAIGIIIISKQVHVLLGVKPVAREPLHLIMEIPESLYRLNPEIALIGLVSVAIMFGLPLFRNRYLKRIPAPMVVLLVAVPLGLYFELERAHTYTFLTGATYKITPKDLLVNVPMNVKELIGAITLPNMDGLATWIGWKYVVMFALVGSLESILSAKAIDLLDPWRRKTNLNRDLTAIGVANTISAMVGGLPMISEIVRSKANIDNGARTRFADFWHGLFLLGFIALLPQLVHEIPLTALAAMLIYTGFRLASPREWMAVYKVGPEQLIIFSSTVFGVLAIDLLAGIGIGILVKFTIHVLHFVPFRAFFRPDVSVEKLDEKTCVVHVRDLAVFSNWIALKKQILSLDHGCNVVVDLSETRLVDHTVMEKLHELEQEFHEQDRKLEISGLDSHRKLSDHPHAARKKVTS
jgi:MFS superfamily sulfate permease-like transporter